MLDQTDQRTNRCTSCYLCSLAQGWDTTCGPCLEQRCVHQLTEQADEGYTDPWRTSGAETPTPTNSDTHTTDLAYLPAAQPKHPRPTRHINMS